ncbi:MAG TPA: DMT family transporter [Legionellaceae bacterium]|nr:DMT family transporter [Legionellaceae bacterium]
MNSSSASKGMPWLFCAQIMVATNIVISKSLLTLIPILIMMNIRFALAALILLPMHWCISHTFSIRKEMTNLTRKDWIFILAQALSAGVLFNCLMLKGLHSTDANIAGIITSALPAMIALFSCVFLKETLSLRKIICILLASTGLLVIAYDKFEHLSNDHSFLGDAIILFSLVPEAGYYILTKVHTIKLPIFLIASLLNAINAMILLPFAWLQPWNIHSFTPMHWLIMVILGLSAALFYVFWLKGSQTTDGTMASLSTAVMPVATVIIAWLLLGEDINLYESLGLGLVLSSIYMYAKR